MNHARPIQASTEEELRMWLGVSTVEWDDLDSALLREIRRTVPFLVDIQDKLANLLFSFTRLKEPDLLELIVTNQDSMEKLQQILSKKLSKGVDLTPLLQGQHDLLADLVDDLWNKETKTIGLLMTKFPQGPEHTASFFQWMNTMGSHAQENWESSRVQVKDWWIRCLSQLHGELKGVVRRFDDLPEPSRKARLSYLLDKASEMLLERSGNHVMTDRLKSAKYQMVEKMADPDNDSHQLLEKPVRADNQTMQFIFGTLCPQEPRLHPLKYWQDPQKPVLYCAKIANPLTIQALSKFLRVKKRGKYSYNMYEVAGDPILYYSGWMISDREAPLLNISSGKSLTHKSALTFRFDRKASPIREAAVLRATFTSNARFDDAFLDFMRGLEAKKIAPNTWDIPVKNSSDIESMRAQLQQDWGYPFIYENVETPSPMLDMFDVNASSKWASLARVVNVKAQHLTLQPSSPEVCVKAANTLMDLQGEVVVPALRDRIAKAASNLLVVHEMLVADEAISDGRFADLSPRVGSTIVLGSEVFWVTSNLVDGWGWLEVEDKENTAWVVTRPDLRSCVALMTPQDFSEKQDLRGATNITTVALGEDAQMFNIPTFMSVNMDGQNFLINPEELIKVDMEAPVIDTVAPASSLDPMDMEMGMEPPYITEGVSPLGGQPGLLYMNPNMPAPGMPSDLSYPTPGGFDRGLLKPLDMKFPVNPSQETPVFKNLVDEDMTKFKTEDETEGLQLGPHPNSGLLSEEPGDTTDQLSVTVMDPLMQIRMPHAI